MAKILVADDSAPFLEALSRIIPELDTNWQVCCAVADGAAAVEKTAELKPDLVILDFMMPAVDGFTAARSIRALFPQVPILIYSFMVFPELENAAREAGIEGVLEKGSPRALAGEIRRLLALRPTHTPLPTKLYPGTPA